MNLLVAVVVLGVSLGVSNSLDDPGVVGKDADGGYVDVPSLADRYIIRPPASVRADNGAYKVALRAPAKAAKGSDSTASVPSKGNSGEESYKQPQPDYGTGAEEFEARGTPTQSSGRGPKQSAGIGDMEKETSPSSEALNTRSR